MIKVSSKSGRPEQSKFSKLFYDKNIVQKWKTRTIQIWIIIIHFSHYIGKCAISIHFWIEISCEFLKSFQKWMKIGPQFPSIFGSGTYMKYDLAIA